MSACCLTVLSDPNMYDRSTVMFISVLLWLLLTALPKSCIKALPPVAQAVLGVGHDAHHAGF